MAGANLVMIEKSSMGLDAYEITIRLEKDGRVFADNLQVPAVA